MHNASCYIILHYLSKVVQDDMRDQHKLSPHSGALSIFEMNLSFGILQKLFLQSFFPQIGVEVSHQEEERFRWTTLLEFPNKCLTVEI